MFSCLLISFCMVLGAAQPPQDHLCDPQTEYAADGQCCRMCAPGKRMSLLNCRLPVCEDCDDGEYQEAYNKEERCKRQPYCDSNKNFEAPVQESKTVKITCLCKLGYHCSSKECITCVPHTTCQPGQEVLFKGNQTQDTVCHPCPKETFSNTSNSKCMKWTRCSEGFHVTRNGSSRADAVCEANGRNHVFIGVVVGVLVLSIAVLACLLYKYLRTSRYTIEKLDKNDPIEILGPEDSPLTSIHENCLDSALYVMPMECDDEDLASLDFRITENGNCLAQEDGKPARLSRQESQNQPSSHFDSSI